MNIEAMAHARPVVATCYGGAPEIVVHGETGFIADPWDEAAFGDRLARYSPTRRWPRRWAPPARQRVLDHFTLDRQVRAYLTVYRGETACRDGQDASAAARADRQPASSEG